MIHRSQVLGKARLYRGAGCARSGVAVLAALLSACNLGPDYRRPDVELPGAWRETPPGQAASWPAIGWWRGFRSAELDGYIDEARRANFDLAAAIARVRQADAQAKIAGAALLPNVGGSATATNEREQTATGQYAYFHQYAPQLSASYVIDFWGRNRAAQNAAIAAAQASRHDRVTVELTVLTSVALTYFQTIELRDRVAVAQRNLAAAQATLKGLRLQEEAGIATALDVAQQETTVATLGAAIPPLEQQLRQTVHALAILVGRAPESIEPGASTLTDFALPPVRPGLPSELLVRRPDVAEAQDQLIAANANIAVARASFFPTIELTASGGYASSALSTLLQPGSRVFAVAGGLTQPIFDGGVLFGQYELAKARYDELVADYRKAIYSALSDVEDSLVAVEQSNEEAVREDTAVTKARRANKIAQAQLHSGVVSILTVLNTETALFTAEDALIQARYAQIQALVGLYSALGGGWQPEQKA